MPAASRVAAAWVLVSVAVIAGVTATSAPDGTCYVHFNPLPEVGPKPTRQFDQVAESSGVSALNGRLMTVPNCVFGEQMAVTKDEAKSEYTRLILFTDNFPEDARLDYVAALGTSAVVDGGSSCLSERNSGGAAVGDYDNDGWMDLAVTRLQAPPLLYRNLGNGSFVDVTKSTNLLDAFVGAVASTGCQFKLKGKKAPEPFSRCRLGSGGLAWVDVDNDGDVDLYVTSMGGRRHYLLINTNGRFTEEAVIRGAQVVAPDDVSPVAGSSVAAGDFDKDGYLDLFVAEYRPFISRDLRYPERGHMSNSRLLRNRGAEAPGFFEDVTEKAGLDLTHMSVDKLEHLHLPRRQGMSRIPAGVWSFTPVWNDLDNDGWVDLFMSGDFSTTMLFWNNRNGTFSESSSESGANREENAMGVAIGDIDSDGFNDVITTAIFTHKTVDDSCTFGTSGNRVYHNLRNRTFDEWSRRLGVHDCHWGWGVTWIDYDNDGDLDLYCVNGFDMPETTFEDHWNITPDKLFRNPGTVDGEWEAVGPEAGLNGMKPGRGLAVFDYDHDGDLDIFVLNYAETPYLFRNHKENMTKYLRVRVLETAGGRDSFGARIHVAGIGREVGGNIGFQGHGEPIVHFGLEHYNGTTVTVEVHWPASDTMLTVHDVPVNSLLTVVKPTTHTDELSNIPVCSNADQIQPRVPEHPIVGEVFGPPPRRNLGDDDDQEYVLGNLGDPERDDGTVGSQLHAILEGEILLGMPPMPMVDGSANHDGLGAAFTHLRRIAKPAYTDGIGHPIDTNDGRILPGPRFVSNHLAYQSDYIFSSGRLSETHFAFGQFLAHDTDHTPSEGNPHYASKVSMVVPKGDPIFDPEGTGEQLMRFRRSVFDRNTGHNTSAPREQLNHVTSFVDGSMIYGSTKERAMTLRAGRGGLLATSASGTHMPYNTKGLSNDNPLARNITGLYLAGDVRSNIQVQLMAMHTLWVREHNFIAREIQFLLEAQGALDGKSEADIDELVFRHARRVVIAELQSITYNQYLPALLGREWMDAHFPAWSGYKPEVDPRITTELSTTCFRLGHTMVGMASQLLNEDLTVNATLPIKSTFFHPELLWNHGGVDAMLRGLVNVVAQELDIHVMDALRNFLFGGYEEGGLDLFATNIMRAREHGIPLLNGVREALGLRRHTSFNDITSNATLAARIGEIYQHIDDVDVIIGTFAEDHVAGGNVGETMASIFTEGFVKVRDGDKLYYENIYPPSVVDAINQVSLGSLFRRHVPGMSQVRDNVFIVPSGEQQFVPMPPSDD